MPIKNKFILPILLFLVAFIVYSNSLCNNFIDLDDVSGIIENPYINHPSWTGITTLFFPNLIPDRAFEFGFYPIINLLNMACFTIAGGFNPFVFHLMSILAHCFTVIACYFTVLLLGKSERIGFWTAFILAIHPSHTEAINWISANCHLFAALFGFLCIYFYILNTINKKKSVLFYILSMAMFILANMCKVSLITLPFLLLLYEYYIIEEKFSFRNFSINNPLYSVLSFFFISAIFVTIHRYIFPKFTSYVFTLQVFKWGIFYKFPALFMQYLINALLPINHDLAGVSYLPKYFDSFYLSMLILFLVFILICYYFKVTNQKLALFGIIAFVLLLLPAFVKIEASAPFSLRLLYFPSFGIYMAVCLLGGEAWKIISGKSHFAKYAVIILFILTLTGLGFITMEKNKNWYSARAIWSSLLKDYPERIGGLWRLYRLEKDNKKKVNLLEEIIRISEPCAYGYPAIYQRAKFMSYCGLSELYLKLGADDEKIKNIYYDWHNFDPKNAYPIWRLGRYYEDKGLLKKSQGEYEKAVQIYDKCRDFWESLAGIYEKQGIEDKAQEICQQIYKRWPNSEFTITHTKNEEEVRKIFYDRYNSDPKNAYPLWRLGVYYEDKGLLKKAQLEYENAIRVYDKADYFWSSLARIYEKQGLKEKAKDVYQEIYKRWPDSDIATNMKFDSIK